VIISEKDYTDEMKKQIKALMADPTKWTTAQVRTEKNLPNGLERRMQDVELEEVGMWREYKGKPTIMVKRVTVKSKNGTISYGCDLEIATRWVGVACKVLFSSMYGLGEKADVAKDFKHGITVYADKDAAARVGQSFEDYMADWAREERNLRWVQRSGGEFMASFPQCLSEFITSVRNAKRTSLQGSTNPNDKAIAADEDELDEAVRDEFRNKFWMGMRGNDASLKKRNIDGTTLVIRTNVWRKRFESKEGDNRKGDKATADEQYPWLAETLKSSNSKYVEWAKIVKANFANGIIFSGMDVTAYRWVARDGGQVREEIKFHPFDHCVNADAIVLPRFTLTHYATGIYFGVNTNHIRTQNLIFKEFVEFKPTRQEEYPEAPPPLPPAPNGKRSAADEYPEDNLDNGDDDDGHSQHSRDAKRQHTEEDDI
jgi:hypothetical protein